MYNKSIVMDKSIKKNNTAAILIMWLLLAFMASNLIGLASDIKMYVSLGLFALAATIFIKAVIQGNIQREKVVFTFNRILPFSFFCKERNYLGGYW